MERISAHGTEQQRIVKAALLCVSIPIAIRCGGGLLCLLLSFKRIGGPVPWTKYFQNGTAGQSSLRSEKILRGEASFRASLRCRKLGFLRHINPYVHCRP
jgi:hypothetical protein